MDTKLLKEIYMNKTLIKAMFALLFTFTSTVINAQAIQEGTITKLFVSHDLSDKVDAKRVIVRLGADIKNGLCPKKVYWQMLLNNPAEKAQYDMLLASYMNDKKVRIWGNKTAQCIHKGERIRNVEVVH